MIRNKLKEGNNQQFHQVLFPFDPTTIIGDLFYENNPRLGNGIVEQWPKRYY